MRIGIVVDATCDLPPEFITEHGIAELKGRTVRERAVALSQIAHPAFRAELTDAASQLR